MFSLKHLVAIVATVVATSASAIPTYVGSWTVDQGPAWGPGPLAYTGQEAAALLFGGTAGEYSISTIDNTIENIDASSWVSVWGVGSSKVAQDFKVSSDGNYVNRGDTSAYVTDHAVGAQFTNYAFAVTVAAVPEPETYALMLAGLIGVGAAVRRRKQPA